MRACRAPEIHRAMGMGPAKKKMDNRAPRGTTVYRDFARTAIVAKMIVQRRAKRVTYRARMARAGTFPSSCRTTLRRPRAPARKPATVMACANWPMGSIVPRAVNAPAAIAKMANTSASKPQIRNRINLGRIRIRRGFSAVLYVFVELASMDHLKLDSSISRSIGQLSEETQALAKTTD